MSEERQQVKFLQKIQTLVLNNLKYILSGLLVLFLFFISFQTYNYYSLQKIKNNSILFFKSIENSDLVLENFNELKINDNIYATLAKLKLIQKYNKDNDYDLSNELYKEILISNNLSDLYNSSFAINASYTLIDASYLKNTKKYVNDIKFYINIISDDIDSYFSTKKELQYLLLLLELDINKSDYKTNIKALEFYNEIYNSDLVSSSVKERVKKIHEFELYK